MRINVRTHWLSILLTGIILFSLASSVPFAYSQTFKLAPTDDTWVEIKDPTRTHGNDNKIHTGSYYNSPGVRRAFLKFDLSTIPGSVSSAKLSLFLSAGDDDPEVFAAQLALDAWSEELLDWNSPVNQVFNSPGAQTCASITVGKGNQAYEWIVTGCVQQELAGDKKISLVVRDPNDLTTTVRTHKDFSSKEDSKDNNNRRPFLDVTTSIVSTVTTTVTETITSTTTPTSVTTGTSTTSTITTATSAISSTTSTTSTTTSQTTTGTTTTSTSTSPTTTTTGLTTGTTTTTTTTTGTACVPAGSAGFAVSASPSSFTLPQGGTGIATITLQSLNCFTGIVILSVSSGNPFAGTLTILPNPAAVLAGGSATSALTIELSTSIPPGLVQLTVSGSSQGVQPSSATISVTVTSGTVTTTTTATTTDVICTPQVTVPCFLVAASPTSLTIPPGTSATVTITVQSLNGFNKPVTLSVTAVPQFQGSLSILPNPVTPPPNGIITATLTVTLDAGAGAPASITLTVTGSSNPKSSVTIPVAVPSNCGDGGTGPNEVEVDTVTGKGKARFRTNKGGYNKLIGRIQASLPVVPAGFSFPWGFFEFNILATAGDTAIVTVTLPGIPVAPNTVWVKVKGSSVILVPVCITSTTGGTGGGGINQIVITLQDGGNLDDDGAANGVIVDPGGPGIPDTTPPTISGPTTTPSSANPGGSFTVCATITDASGVASATATVTKAGGAIVSVTLTKNPSSDLWCGTFASSSSDPVGGYAVSISATDTVGNTGSATGQPFSVTATSQPPTQPPSQPPTQPPQSGPPPVPPPSPPPTSSPPSSPPPSGGTPTGGGTPTQPSGPCPSGLAQVTGTVLDSSGRPVQGVTITSSSGQTTQTDGNGQWSLLVTCGTITFTATKSGFRFQPPSTSAVVTSATQISFIAFQLGGTPSGPIQEARPPSGGSSVAVVPGFTVDAVLVGVLLGLLFLFRKRKR